LATIIEIQNLTHRYGRLTAVNELSLKIEEGSIFGFIGPNGAGKTTTMRILATLLRPTSGEAWVGGCSVRKDPRGVRKQIGYMPDFFGVYNEMKVWEYLDFFAACYDIPVDARRAHRPFVPLRAGRAALVDDLLELVDLTHRRDDYVDSLSRGMKQRLCLARTLAHDPKVLILDEPASGLDPRARIEIRELLRELQAMDKTIFLSSHILLEVAEICTMIGIIEAGNLVTCGSIEEIQAAGRRRRHTRRVQVTLAGRSEEAMSLLQSSPNVIDVTLTERRVDKGLPPERLVRSQPQGEQVGKQAPQDRAFELIVDFIGDDLAQTAILTRLIQAGLPVLSFREIEVELEDVFMQVTKGIAS